MKGLLAKRSQNWLPLLAMLTLLPIWEGVCHLFAVPTFILPAPSDIALAFTQVSAERWLDNLWATLRIALFGFALSFALSIPLAIMMVFNPCHLPAAGCDSVHARGRHRATTDRDLGHWRCPALGHHLPDHLFSSGGVCHHRHAGHAAGTD